MVDQKTLKAAWKEPADLGEAQAQKLTVRIGMDAGGEEVGH